MISEVSAEKNKNPYGLLKHKSSALAQRWTHFARQFENVLSLLLAGTWTKRFDVGAVQNLRSLPSQTYKPKLLQNPCENGASPPLPKGG